MSDSILVVAPHPDDETLGCGGTLLRHIAHGDRVHWLIVTDMTTAHGYAEATEQKRAGEIRSVAAAYGFASVHNLALPPARLDTLPQGELVAAIGRVIKEVSPRTIYLPFRGDVHSDHRVVFDSAISCTKWFRYPSIRRVLCYEALSETDFCLDPQGRSFAPNCFVDISNYLEQKLAIAQLFDGEILDFPFPRSVQALRSLAQVRGAACGVDAAEAFMILKEIVDG